VAAEIQTENPLYITTAVIKRFAQRIEAAGKKGRVE
jgi:hypothetical protein